MILRAVYTLGKLGLKSKRGKKALSWGAKRLRKKLAIHKQMASYKGVHKKVPLRVKGQKVFTKTKFQKSKIGGGSERHPQQLSYGVGAKEHKISQKLTSIAARRPAYKGAHHLDESWHSEMTRVFGGLDTGPRSLTRLHKSYAKDIRKLRKKLKTKLSVGGLVIGKNVDLSLL